jgi:FG-GAP repeat
LNHLVSPNHSLPINLSHILVLRSGDFEQVQAVEAEDGRSGDSFGASLAIDGGVLVVGAPLSAAVTTTTWDFETGTLAGWTAEGAAFVHQPTFGDNSLHREEQSRTRFGGRAMGGSSTHVQGRYFIGTYEKRPGNRNDYR